VDKDCRQSIVDAIRSSGAEAIQRARHARRQRALKEEEQQARLDGEKARLDEDRTPLKPQHWIENEHYAGDLASRLYPELKRVFVEVFERRVFEILMRGAIGYGKTTAAIAILKYVLYLLTCRADPHGSFRRPMVRSAPIALMNMNVSEGKARDAFFDQFNESVKTTEYFQGMYKPNMLTKLQIPRKRILVKPVGASKTAAESENLLAVVLDEVNLYDDVEKSARAEGGTRYDEARVVHTAAVRRMTSRYIHSDGSFPPEAKLILLCKETYRESFLAKREREVREKEWDKPDKNGRQRCMILNYAEWETKPKHFWFDEGAKESERWFWVKTSTATEPAEIIMSKARASVCRSRLKEMKEAGEQEVPILKKVPRYGGEYVATAEDDVENFIRDVLGIPTDAIGVFFKDRSLIAKARRRWEERAGVGGFDVGGKFYRLPRDLEDHPFVSEVDDLRGGLNLVKERLARDVEEDDGDGGTITMTQPLAFPEAPRFMHFDLGISSDATGVGMVAPVRWVTERRVNRSEEATEVEEVISPMLWVDFVMAFTPPEGGQVPLHMLLKLVQQLKEWGFSVARVTADGYQSAMILQECERLFGAETEVVSLDKTTEGYHEFHRAHREGRILVPANSYYEREVRELERHVGARKVKGKVVHYEFIDHPASGGKDASDGAAGATWQACVHAERFTLGAPAPEVMKKERRDPVVEGHSRELEAREAIAGGNLERLFEMEREDDDTGGW
jgi:hypothetical protein